MRTHSIADCMPDSPGLSEPPDSPRRWSASRFQGQWTLDWGCSFRALDPWWRSSPGPSSSYSQSFSVSMDKRIKCDVMSCKNEGWKREYLKLTKSTPLDVYIHIAYLYYHKLQCNSCQESVESRIRIPWWYSFSASAEICMSKSFASSSQGCNIKFHWF